MRTEGAAVSTCFFTGKGLSVPQILEKAVEFRTPRLELEYRLSVGEFNEIRRRLPGSACAVDVLHNICPRPEHIPVEKADADFYRLCSSDEDERRTAVAWAVNTVRAASEIGAPFAVLHLGDTGQDKLKAVFHRLADLRGDYSAGDRLFLEEYVRERSARSRDCYERAARSLEEIIGEARRRQVTIGIENRYYVHQVPDFNELESLMSTFHGAPLGVWLDFGHAFVQGLLGRPGLDDYIRAFQGRITGCHLHDCRGSSDHRPPGSGEIEFRRYAAFLRELPVVSLEIRPKHGDSEFLSGAGFIRDLLYDRNN